jgi:acyl transferase domain-containing protein
VIDTLRRGESGLDRVRSAVAEATVHGAPLDWGTVFAGCSGEHVELPTYPFQRERYWLEASSAPGDLAASGLRRADHRC